MTTTTPREALDNVKMQLTRMTGTWKLGTVAKEAILTALAPFLRTPGTVEVCSLCGGPSDPMSQAYAQPCPGLDDKECPLKQVTNEKA